MVEVLSEAVRFVTGLCDTSLNADVKIADIAISCVSADSIQGETLDYMILALPPNTKDWSEWLCEPSRLLTIISRYRWQLAMTYVINNGVSQNKHLKRLDQIDIVTNWQKRADATWKYGTLAGVLGYTFHDIDTVWDSWMTEANKYVQKRRTPEPVAIDHSQERRAATASATKTKNFSQDP